jgi:hypothetical protein
VGSNVYGIGFSMVGQVDPNTKPNTVSTLHELAAAQPLLMSEVRQFAASFEAQPTPLPSHTVGELTLRLHAILCDAEARLVAELPEERQHLAPSMRDALEKYLLTRLYPSLFAAGEADLTSDAALCAQLTRLQPLFTPARLGVAAPFRDAPREVWDPAIDMLRRLNRYRAPRDKASGCGAALPSLWTLRCCPPMLLCCPPAALRSPPLASVPIYMSLSAAAYRCVPLHLHISTSPLLAAAPPHPRCSS